MVRQDRSEGYETSHQEISAASEDGHQISQPIDSSIQKALLPRRTVDDSLYSALDKIGSKSDERKGRNIVFHSWRYFFNTLCRSRGVPDSVTQVVMGHKTPSMTQLYTSFPISELKTILALNDVVFPGFKVEVQ